MSDGKKTFRCNHCSMNNPCTIVDYHRPAHCPYYKNVVTRWREVESHDDASSEYKRLPEEDKRLINCIATTVVQNPISYHDITKLIIIAGEMKKLGYDPCTVLMQKSMKGRHNDQH